MNKKCPHCRVVNFADAEKCVRCQAPLETTKAEPGQQFAVGTESQRTPAAAGGLLRRAAVCAAVCLVSIFGFYLSLLLTSKALPYEEKQSVRKAIDLLEAKGFAREVFLLRRLTSFRADDNWLNASTRDENAYGATNFPFEIITIYPEFFTVPRDDVERAMVLLHEAQHLRGSDEKEAYEFVWRNRKSLGWTREAYGASKIYINVEKQTREFAPHLFRCDWNPGADCTE